MDTYYNLDTRVWKVVARTGDPFVGPPGELGRVRQRTGHKHFIINSGQPTSVCSTKSN